MDLSYERSFPTPLSNSPLLPLLLLTVARQKHTPEPSKVFKDEYDYIVVGAGAAGCVVASRLSEISCVDVLLLEAGEEPPFLTEVPALARYLRNFQMNWQYKTVPQKFTGSGLMNRQIIFTTGKMLGGSGSINGLAYVRGNRRDYDQWSALGAEGWSYKDVFPYFLKLENNRNLEYLANGYHAVGGPITVEVPNYDNILKYAVYEAAMELGFEILDSNAEKQVGFYDIQGFTRRHQRCNSLKGYIVPAANRNNLDILTKALVTKIIIEDNKATGVEFLYRGNLHVVKARKEVIMSAGVVNSAKIMMLSGIGPREELDTFGIPVVADLPVGKNFHDDAGTHFIFTLNKQFRGFDDKITDHINILEYVFFKTGPLASIDGLNMAFLSYANDSEPADYPDYELYINELPRTFPKDLELKPEVYKQIFGPYEGRALFECVAQTLAPKSRGTITLNSSDPLDPPLIDPNYLQVPSDITNIVQGLKTCKKLLNTPPLRALGAKPLKTLVPGCERYVNDDDEYFKCWAKTLLFTFHHPAGTCKMGDPKDPTAVVDPELRVKGVAGLRVVDASIMPIVTRGNTYIPTIMIAEKASDMIKNGITC